MVKVKDTRRKRRHGTRRKRRQGRQQGRGPGHSTNMHNWPKARYLAYQKQLLLSNAAAYRLEQQARVHEQQARAREEGSADQPPPAPNAPSPATRANSRQQPVLAADPKLMAAPVQPCDRANPDQALKDLEATVRKHSKTACLLRFVPGKYGPLLDAPMIAKDLWSPPFVT